MKFLKTAAVLLIAVLMLGGLAACERETVSDGGESQIGSGEVSEMFVPNEEASVFWKDEYAGGGFDGPDDLGIRYSYNQEKSVAILYKGQRPTTTQGCFSEGRILRAPWCRQRDMPLRFRAPA